MLRAGRKAGRSGDRGFFIIQHPYISRFSDLDKGDLKRWGRIDGELGDVAFLGQESVIWVEGLVSFL